MHTHTQNTKIQFLPSTSSQYNKRDKETTSYGTVNYNTYVYRILVTAEMTCIQILMDSREYPVLFTGWSETMGMEAKIKNKKATR